MVTTTLDLAFPSKLRSQSKAAASVLNLSSDCNYEHLSLNVLGEDLLVPSRVPSPTVKPNLSGLTLQQRQMAQCMLTRSTDGFERQAALKEILAVNEPWSIPFVIALCGDYVVEIIDDIYVAVPHFNRQRVATFIEENPVFYKLTCDRMVSYWNCYYRWEFGRQDYVGFKLLKELAALIQR